MYSKVESQRLKQQFWVAFAEKYPRKWLLYDTKIKDFSFKFFVDNKKSQVLIDIEMRDSEKRMAYLDKLQSLRTILEEEYVKNLIYEKNYTLESGKIISRIWIEQNNISVSNKENWDEIFSFFNFNMNLLEAFFIEYEDYIKDI